MCSFMFTVVQSFENLTALNVLLGHALTTSSSSVSQPHVQFLSLTSCSGCALQPIQCTPSSDMNSRRLLRASTLVNFRHHFDTGYHRSHSPCDSHLNRHVLAATSLVWPGQLSQITLCISATSPEGLVSSTPRSYSTLKRLPISCSSSLIELFLEVSLIVAWKPRHTHVVLLGLCILPSSLQAAG